MMLRYLAKTDLRRKRKNGALLIQKVKMIIPTNYAITAALNFLETT